VVVAIVIATITAALGLVGAITGQTVAVVLGGLIGFVLAKSQSEPDSHETGSSKKGLRPGWQPMTMLSPAVVAQARARSPREPETSIVIPSLCAQFILLRPK
jgi:hypothetical protein